jgi:hypothetical protein
MSWSGPREMTAGAPSTSTADTARASMSITGAAGRPVVRPHVRIAPPTAATTTGDPSSVVVAAASAGPGADSAATWPGSSGTSGGDVRTHTIAAAASASVAASATIGHHRRPRGGAAAPTSRTMSGGAELADGLPSRRPTTCTNFESWRAGQQHVLRDHVPIAEPTGSNCADRRIQLADDGRDPLCVEALRTSRGQAPALDQPHVEEDDPLVHAVGVNRHDVRLAQRAEQGPHPAGTARGTRDRPTGAVPTA